MHPLEFDARPVIAAGDEPSDQIMAAVASLAEGQDFVLYAPFEPVPLEGVLGSQGFLYEAEPVGGGDWKVTFRQAS